MTTVEVFDPPMCCSTGVCGPSVDPALATFAADLQWAGESGATVMRYNLAQEPGRFAVHDEVRKLLTDGGEGALPVVVVDGSVRSSGRYPARSELAAWALPGTAADVLEEAGLLGASQGALAGAAAGAESAPTGQPAAAAAAAGACCGGETAVTPAGVDTRASGRIAELPLIEVVAPCCGGGTAEGAAEAGQAGCCG